MNKILTQTGGQPVFLDDIDFSSQATRDAFKALCRALSLDDIGTCILQGCDVTISGAQFTWTEGYIAIKGEIYKVDAGTINSMRLPFWVVKKNKTENRTFEDESNKPVWEVSYVTLSGTYESDEEYAPYIGVKKYNDILRDKLFSFEEIDIPVTIYTGRGISATMKVKKYASFRKIIVEITELAEYFEDDGPLFYFSADNYQYVKDVVMASTDQKTFDFLMLGFFSDGENVSAVYHNVHNTPLKKGFNQIVFQITV